MHLKGRERCLRRRFIALALAPLGIFLVANAQAAEATPADEISILYAGTLLSEPGRSPMESATILVRNGVVEDVREGRASPQDLGVSDAAKVVDLSNMFVMPGFLDLHVHLSGQYDVPRDDLVRKTDSYRALRAAEYAERTLMAGFTTVRDLGSRGDAIFALRDSVRDGYTAGPKILVAGSAITPTGGHADIHGYRPDILDVLKQDNTCDGPSDCRRAVRAAVKRGADVIKVTATGGVLSETAAGTGQQFTDEELKAIAETAHALGRKVTAHAHEKGGIQAALRAGFDSIEHAMWADEETMRLFKRTDAWIIPTVYPITFVGDTPEKMKEGPFGDLPPVIMEKLLRLGRQPKEMTRLAHSMGVNIALGTDTAISPHGENAHEFLEYVAAGMTPMESLMAGTVNAAEAAGIDNVGRIAPGMAADIVAMPGDPTENIDAVLGVSFVMRDGIVFRSPEQSE